MPRIPRLSAALARGVYLITPDEPDTGRLIDRTESALEAGITWLQYRNKSAPPDLRKQQARAVHHACRRYGVPLLINDDVELARDIGAEGVHLGEDDGDLAAARQRLGPHAVLGASCYNDPALARRAVAAGADYVAFGAFFSSPTKPAARQATPDVLRQARTLGVPMVAIGGITPDNGAPLVAAGADLLAVISGVYSAADASAAVYAYRSCFTDLP